MVWEPRKPEPPVTQMRGLDIVSFFFLFFLFYLGARDGEMY